MTVWVHELYCTVHEHQIVHVQYSISKLYVRTPHAHAQRVVITSSIYILVAKQAVTLAVTSQVSKLKSLLCITATIQAWDHE